MRVLNVQLVLHAQHLQPSGLSHTEQSHLPPPRTQGLATDTLVKQSLGPPCYGPSLELPDHPWAQDSSGPGDTPDRDKAGDTRLTMAPGSGNRSSSPFRWGKWSCCPSRPRQKQGRCAPGLTARLLVQGFHDNHHHRDSLRVSGGFASLWVTLAGRSGPTTPAPRPARTCLTPPTPQLHGS